MTILDRYKDFYDYLSYDERFMDDTITFDRRNSKLLDKQSLCKFDAFGKPQNCINYIYFHIGYVTWIIKLEFKVIWGRFGCNLDEKSYKMTLIETYKDYDDKYLFGLGHINISEFDIEYLKKYKSLKSFKDIIKFEQQEHLKYNNKSNVVYPLNGNSYNNIKNSDIYILEKTGIPSIINAEDIYLAFDEYFRSLKDDIDVETDLTDNDKIINHGFDKKTSFRKV